MLLHCAPSLREWCQGYRVNRHNDRQHHKNRHHEDFHTRIVDAIHASLTEEECRILIKGLSSFEKNLKDI